jgi:hypothetical protein
MKLRMVRPLAVALSVAGGLMAAQAAEEKFDLRVQLALTPELTSQLQAGDRLQVILRPEVQYEQRSVPGEPIVLERVYEPGATGDELSFPKVLEPDQIYRIEVRVVRGDREVRYLSALDKLPRRPIDSGIKMRLFQGDRRDVRNNHVLVVRDSDGIYRVMLFTA